MVRRNERTGVDLAQPVVFGDGENRGQAGEITSDRAVRHFLFPAGGHEGHEIGLADPLHGLSLKVRR
jgi:hypothetical protein